MSSLTRWTAVTDSDESERATPQYWLPSWWGWVEDWGRCITCLEHNHTPCVSCEIPPGLIGLACLVGGGTATITGTMRGNVGIVNQRQAQAAARVSSAEKVNRQLQRQQQININVNQNKIRRNRNDR